MYSVVNTTLTVNQLLGPPIHVVLSPVHPKSNGHHPHTPLATTQSLHLNNDTHYDVLCD